MSDHRQFFREAKAQQHGRLQDAAVALDQLVAAVTALVSSNSRNSSGKSSVLMDKIESVHEFDREIDRQLRDEIAPNYTRTVRDQQRLAAYVRKCRRTLAVDEKNSYVDVVQRRMELADQEIRMLENTLQLVKARGGNP